MAPPFRTPSDSGRRPLSPTSNQLFPHVIPYGAPPFKSANYRDALSRAEKFSRHRSATVLIQGESGTGKTLLARRIHEMSSQTQAPFRTCVLSALDDALASDELFGHVPGAFTGAREVRAGVFASASGGTVFLDEIGKASLNVQQKLLDAIESHVIVPLGSDRQITVDVRVIAAANVPLDELVREGKFLPDLYARLKIFRIALPPLRDRREDIPILVEQCLTRHAAACGYSSLPVFEEPLMTALMRAPWPDNLRELDGTIHRLLVEADGAPLVTCAHCLDDLSFVTASSKPKAAPNAATVREAVARIKKKSAAARELGTSRSTLYRRLEESIPPSSETPVL